MNNPTSEVAIPADRALVWPMLIPIGATLLLSTTYSFGSILFFPTFVGAALVSIGWLFWGVVSTIVSLWRRTWRRAASLIIALVLFAPAICICVGAGDYIHLAIMLPYYETRIHGSGPNAQTGFDWGAAGLIPNYENSVIYDPSDQLAKKVGHPEASDMETITVRHVIGHWYARTETW